MTEVFEVSEEAKAVWPTATEAVDEAALADLSDKLGRIAHEQARKAMQ